MTTYALLLLLIVNDTPAKPVELSRHETRQACELAAHKQHSIARAQPWPDKATGRVLWCREVKK